MSNYKVKVNNEVESEEAQGLFEQLTGSEYKNSTKETRLGFFALENNVIYADYMQHWNAYDCKEPTIPQLKDLVVLKRNDVSDATHADEKPSSRRGYLTSDGVEYFWNYRLNKWSKLTNASFEFEGFVCITKPLKEYLVPQDNGKYALTKATEKRVSDWVEVPKGAQYATMPHECFWKDSNHVWSTNESKWKNTLGESMDDYLTHTEDAKIVWTRHTQPEELPFVDDEPKRTYGLTREKAERISKNTKDAYLAKYPVDVNDEPKSLNNTYAEIEQVRQTLNERQSTYGDFTSVANTTGQLMAVILNSKNGQTLPYAHEEALHMICSKIARIMNGDINHKDSWHDIAGYATLIDESL